MSVVNTTSIYFHILFYNIKYMSNTPLINLFSESEKKKNLKKSKMDTFTKKSGARFIQKKSTVDLYQGTLSCDCGVACL